DLVGEEVDRGHVDALAGELDGQQLRAGEVEDALGGPRGQLPLRLRQLEVPARIERHDDADDGLAEVAGPGEGASPQADARSVEAQPAAHQRAGRLKTSRPSSRRSTSTQPSPPRAFSRS